jgi:histidinol-phosphate/aromatic aminotransferase/cobyric acid decarboxylase-like protein
MGFARLVQPHIGSRHSRQPYVWIDPLNVQGRLFSFYCAATVTMALSERMCSTVESVMPKIATQLAHRNSSNPPIDFSTAENWLIRPELVEFIKTAVAKELDEHVSSLVLIASYKEISLLTIRSYQKGFCGDPQLLATLANTFNRLFAPTRLVEPSHVAVGPGGAAILESLLLNTCDAGDGMLVPTPFWSRHSYPPNHTTFPFDSLQAASTFNLTLAPK